MMHVEKLQNGLWAVCYPDGDPIDGNRYKSRVGATRYMNFLMSRR